MIKRLICFLLILTLMPCVNICVYGADDTVLLNEAFENTWGNADINGEPAFGSPDDGYGMSAALPTGKYSTIGGYIPDTITSGRYMISFDFYTDNKGEESFRFVDEKASSAATRLRNVMSFRTDGTIGINRVAAPYGDAGDNEYDWPSVSGP